MRTCLSAVAILLWRASSAAAQRVISVADLHGDLEQTVKVLTAAGLLDAAKAAQGDWQWTGGNVTLVQTGDIVDRGDDANKIYELFFKIQEQAPASGGQVVNLLGNHELMDMQDDLRYVSRGDYAAFGGKAARHEAWAARGWLGRRTRHFPAAVVFARTLFSHAGPLPKSLRADQPEGECLVTLNEEIERAISSTPVFMQPQDQSQADLLGDNGPLWNRLYSMGSEKAACEALDEVLNEAGANRMVVGHTVQDRVSTRCGGRLVLADTGMSRAYGGVANFVVHEAGDAWVVYPDSNEHDPLPRPKPLFPREANHPVKDSSALKTDARRPDVVGVELLMDDSDGL